MADQVLKDLRLQGAAQRARALIRELEACLAVVEGREYAPGKRPPKEFRAALADKVDRTFVHHFGAAQLEVLARRQISELVRQAGRCPALQPEALLTALADWFPEYAARLTADDLRVAIAAYRPGGRPRGPTRPILDRGTPEFERRVAELLRKTGIPAGSGAIRELQRSHRPSRRKR